MSGERNVIQWAGQSFSKTALAVGLALMAGTAAASTAPGATAGVEFRVNTTTADMQWHSAVAMDADGDFVVTWQSESQDGDLAGVYAQRFNAAGQAQGAEFRVNTTTWRNQGSPKVAMDSDGDFVVTWVSYGMYVNSSYGVYAQRFNAAGQAQGTEFRVNTATSTSTSNRQENPAVAMDADGDFVVTWDSLEQGGSGVGVYGQRYNAAGQAQGAEFRVNTYTSGDQYSPTVAIDAGGDFVVAWVGSGYQQQSGSFGVYAQRFNAAGQAQGTEFHVNTTILNVFHAAVAMNAGGNFVVTWDSVDQDGKSLVYGQRYYADGQAQGAEFLINTTFDAQQWVPAVAMDADGDFVVTWMALGLDGSFWGVYSRRFDATGLAQGPDFRVNTFTSNNQLSSVVAMDADGDFVVAWQSAKGPDDSNYGVYAQRYAGSEDVNLDLTLSDAPDPVNPSDTLTYSAVVSNLHPVVSPTGVAAIDAAIGSASGVSATLIKPASTSFVGASGDDWSCADGSPEIHCVLGTPLAPAGSSTLSINLAPLESTGMLTATATLDAVQYDSNQTNNSDAENTTVQDPADTIPDPFNFQNTSGVALSSSVKSKTLALTGFSPLLPVSITGGSYRVNGGTWTSAAGTINAGDTVQLKTKSAATYSTAVKVVFTAGTVSDTWKVTTLALDTAPDAFTFPSKTNVAPNVWVNSSKVVPVGYTVAATVSITGGQYRITTGGVTGAWTTAAGSMSPGDTIQVRVKSATTPTTTTSTTVNVGGTAVTFSVTTAP